MIILYWFLVQRRIGGLEIGRTGYTPEQIVQRRIGGLEIAVHSARSLDSVQRRIGGLENRYFLLWP